MGEITDQQKEEIRDAAIEVVLEKSGMGEMFKPANEWKQEMEYMRDTGILPAGIQWVKESGDSVHQEGVIGTPNAVPTESVVTLDEDGNATITHQPIANKKGKKPKVQIQDKATDAQALIQ